MNFKIIVNEDNYQDRLDCIISSVQDEISRSFAKKLIEIGNVIINGEKATKVSYKPKLGDIIDIHVDEAKNLDAKPQNIPIEIVYEDNDLLVVNKPIGIVVHPASTMPDGTLVNALLYHIKDLSGINGVLRPGIVHRLDKDTSGLVVVAKNDKAHIAVAKQLADRSMKRSYVALLQGNLKDNEGIIEKPIGRSQKDRKQMAVTLKGRYAKTEYKVLKHFKGYDLAEFKLFTGRTHQIRVHAKAIGHPIIGDIVYGKKNNEFGITHQLLHSNCIGFIHPTTNEYVEFSVEYPADFAAIVFQLEANNRLLNK